jgi:hypothetical protein
MITAYDAQADEVTTMALADVAADIRRYELLGTADSGAGPWIHGAVTAERAGGNR